MLVTKKKKKTINTSPSTTGIVREGVLVQPITRIENSTTYMEVAMISRGPFGGDTKCSQRTLRAVRYSHVFIARPSIDVFNVQ